MSVERLLLPQSRRLARHRAPLAVVRHVVQGGDQLAARVRRRQDVAFAAVTMSSLAPFCAVVITGRPQARASSTTSEHGS